MCFLLTVNFAKECHFEGKHLMSFICHPVKQIQINHKIIQKSNPSFQ